MRKRRVTYRPSKAQGAFGMVWGGVFILIGLFVVIPTFGPFGILWTLAAIGITAMNGYQAFGTKYTGPEITIEEDNTQMPQEHPSSPAPQTHDHIPSTALDAKQRLEQLESLKQAGLITQSEYDQKRREILEKL
ncbi:SHOCT domain-containing protein [Lawsonibacter sp. LCP25S3_G6]|uniref:SHOCT domain-containing protein n=1 Tax=unclassified Lawsonibacter TaxID=2617946 RepID=UPI003F99C8D2